MSYKHGIYTESVNTIGRLSTREFGTVPVYIGTSPSGTANVPVLISSYNDFVSKFGYDDDWDANTLCEVAYAHFKNPIHTIAPIICIKIATADKTNVEAALAAIDKAPIKCGIAPNIIVVPKYSHTYITEILAKCTNLIGGKWGCVAYIDIPTDTVDTIAEALEYKSTNKIASKLLRLHYPKAIYGGKVFHLSVLDAVASQVVDNESDGVSCHSSSNQRIMCDVPVIDEETEILYSEAEANSLNEKGITTINHIGGSFRLWGGHMANYDHATIDSIEAKDRSDATVRMQIYLDNWLKREFVDHIDRPLTRRDIDNIISNVNIALNSFVNSGYLLKGECYFDDGENVTAELADGNLVLDVLHTEVPNGKSISFKLQYDLSGLNALYATEEV